MKTLLDAGYMVIVIASCDEYSHYFTRYGIKYIPIKMKMNKNPLTDIIIFMRYCVIFKRLKPDVFLGYTAKPNIYGTVAAKIFGVKVISNIAGLGSNFITRSYTSYIIKILYSYAIKLSDLVLFQNKDDLNAFINMRLLRHKRYDCLPGSGVDLNKFAYSKMTEFKNINFLFIGRLLKDKGIYEFIEASCLVKKNYNNVTFQILGSCDSDNPTSISSNELMRLINNTAIEYLGHQDDVIPIMKNSTCVVLPSYREGTPKSLLEAAAIGRPIITTNAVGCKEVVDNGKNGYLCKVSNVSSLFDAMEKFINLSFTSMTKMGEEGRHKIVNKFDEKTVHKRYLAAIANFDIHSTN
jgi:glycosyltransferase involved in cell wall biosynthesis